MIYLIIGNLVDFFLFSQNFFYDTIKLKENKCNLLRENLNYLKIYII